MLVTGNFAYQRVNLNCPLLASSQQVANGHSQQLLPSWIGGQATVPYEQYTRQSPGLGFNTSPQPLQS